MLNIYDINRNTFISHWIWIYKLNYERLMHIKPKNLKTKDFTENGVGVLSIVLYGKLLTYENVSIRCDYNKVPQIIHTFPYFDSVKTLHF